MSRAFEELSELLHEREQADGADAGIAVDARIHGRFGARRAVLITDMSGFSKVTKEHGILHFLALIERMKRLCTPALRAHEGRLIKMMGDDLFCAFPHAEAAVRAAISMRDACERDAEGRETHDAVRLAIGIGFGEVLDLDGEDLFGDEVNRASKLGEDIAEPGEILVTASVAEHTGEIKGWGFEQRNARVSGITFDYYAATPNN